MIWPKIFVTSPCPQPLRKLQNAKCSRGIGGRYHGPLEEIAEGITLVGPDLCGESRSSEPKAAAGEDLRTAATSREKGVVGKKGNCQFSLLPDLLNPLSARASGSTA